MPLSPFKRAAAELVGKTLGLDPGLFPVSTPPDPALGDYAVGCFPAAKLLKAAPPALAKRVADAFQPDDTIVAAQAAGPYLNVRVNRASFYKHLFESAELPTDVGRGKTVCIDFSSPNIAKELAYHHIRSTVIGHALVNLHRALGWKVIGINHLGDWGTTFGMILSAMETWGVPEPFTIEALNDLYVRFRARAEGDPAFEQGGRDWFKKLEDGDPVATERWQRMRDVSLTEFQQAYDTLGVRFDEVRGESEYVPGIPEVIRLLEQKGLSSMSEGALVVDLADKKMPPLLLKKADGATLYATRDLAAALYRWRTYHFDRSLYVVAREQELPLAQLFETLRRAGFDFADRMVHVSFGLVRIGGKKSGTRTGNRVLLTEVLGEARAKVAAKLAETNPDLAPADADAIARDVGIGAVVFANLASKREKDVDFDLDEVTSFEGDSGPYVQYAHARTAGILRRAGHEAGQALELADPARLERDEEWALAKQLHDFRDEVARSIESCEPHITARYLLDVCAAFSRWYTLGNQDPGLKVLAPDEATRRARLALTAATQRTLKQGLEILGIEAPDTM